MVRILWIEVNSSLSQNMNATFLYTLKCQLNGRGSNKQEEIKKFNERGIKINRGGGGQNLRNGFK